MKAYPLDPTRLGSMNVLAVAPKIGDRETGEQRTNQAGMPGWTAQILLTPPAREDGSQPKAELLDVGFYSAEAPAFAPMTPVMLANPVARAWEMGGRSGVAISADALVAARQARGE